MGELRRGMGEPTPNDELGPDIGPDGNFIKADEATELSERKGKFLNFNAYDKGWMRVPENEALFNKIKTEYEQSPVEARMLANIVDATVEGVNLFDTLSRYSGEDFFQLRQIQDYPQSLAQNWEAGTDLDPLIGDGYHKHGNSNEVSSKFRDFMSKMDATVRLKESGEDLLSFVTSGTEFSADDIASVNQFATSIVVTVKKEAWEKYHTLDDPDVKVTGFYQINKSVIYIPEDLPKSHINETLRHEYTHMIDDAVKTTAEYGSDQKFDEQLFHMKTEISASLENHFAKVTSLDQAIRYTKGRMLEGGYELLIDTPEKRKRFEKFFSIVRNIVPLLESLIRETGLDPEVHRIEFAKKFLAMLPNRPITYKMLERISETGLFMHGQKAA